MTREELYKRLTDIEWDDFEVKEAKSELPKSIWETVSAFSNTSGGWIVDTENAGYGIDKMLIWERYKNKTVDFQSNIVSSTVTYFFDILRYETEKEEEKGEETEIEVNKTTPVKEIELTGNCLMIYRLIKATPNLTTEQITEYSKIGFEGVKYNLKKLKDNGYIVRRGGRKFGYWVVLK